MANEDAIAKANEEALAEMHQGIKAADEDDDGPPTPVVEPQDPEEIETPNEPKGEAKRRNRYREQVEARETLARENNDLKIRLAAIEAARQYAPQQVQQKTEQKDEYEEKVKTLQKDQEELVKTHRAIQGTDENAEAARESLRQQYMAKNADIQRTYAEQAVRKNGAGQAPVDIDHQVRLAQMRDRYADVVNHADERPLKYADSIWKAELVRLGRIPNQTETDRIFDQARRQFGLAVSPAPSQGTRAKFSGTPQGARGGNGVVESTKKSYPMNKEYLKMARAAHPGKPDNVAFQMWVNDMNE